MDLTQPEANLRAFMKTRASLDGADTFTWFAGTVTAWLPGEQAVPLFGMEGYNVARAREVEGGFDLLSREAVFYLDPATREIIDTWHNPFTNDDVEVLHIWNDPVNLPMRLDGPRGPFYAPVTEIGDELFFNVDVFLAYPSPLPRADWPEESQSDLYQAAELFQFFTKKAAISSTDPAAPCLVSWTRLGPWLPWMKMGDRPGQLVYHCRGAKLGSFDELPARIKQRVEADGPQYRTAPAEFTQPNETSWTYYKRHAAASTTG